MSIIFDHRILCKKQKLMRAHLFIRGPESGQSMYDIATTTEGNDLSGEAQKQGERSQQIRGKDARHHCGLRTGVGPRQLAEISRESINSCPDLGLMSPFLLPKRPSQGPQRSHERV